MKKRLFNIFFLLVSYYLSTFSLSLYSQEFDPTYYTAKDGIAQGHHGYILQDFNGFIWSTSQGGLTRFDGHNSTIINYDYRSNRVLNINEQSPIYQTKDSLLWIGSYEGLYMYNTQGEIFTFFDIDSTNTHGHPYPELTEIIEVNGTLWISCYAGLYSFNKENGEFSYYDPIPDQPYRDRHHSDKAIRAIVRDKYNDNILWLGGRSRLYKFDTKDRKYLKTWQIETITPKIKKEIFSILQISPDVFLLGTYGSGLLRFDTKKQKTVFLKTDSDIIIQNKPFSIVRDMIFVDSTKILCTNFNGALFTYDTIIKSVNYLDDIDVKKKSFKLVKDRDHNIWVASAHGLTKLKYKNIRFYPSDANKKYDNITSKYNPYNNSFLSYTTEGKIAIEAFSHSENKMVTISIKQIGSINDIAIDSVTHGFLILGKQGLYILANNNNDTPIKLINLSNHRFSTVFSTKNYIYLWNRKQIVVYNHNGRLDKTIKTPSTLMGTKVYLNYFYIFDDTIYYIKDHQIYRLESNKKFNLILNESTQVISEFIIIDSLCFVASKKGLFKYNFKDNKFVIDDSFDNPYKSQELYQITRANDVLYMNNLSGIVGYNFKTDKKVLKINDRNNLHSASGFSYHANKLYGYTRNSYFSIDLKTNNEYIHDIYIKELLIPNFRVEYPVKSNLELKHNQNSIYVKWTPIYYGYHDDIEYSYSLDDDREHWIDIGSSGSMTLSNLSPGNFTLLVKATAFDNIIEKKLLNFNITAPWWKRWWFLSLIAIIGIVLIYLFNRFRVNQISLRSKHEQEMVEMELNVLRAQMNPHFIFNSLNSIKRLIQKRDSENAIEYLMHFSLMIRQILSNSDKKLISLENEIDFLKRYLEIEKLRFGNKFDYYINIDKNIDLSEIQIPPLILQPFLENSLWHGIMNKKDKGSLNLTIKDYSDYIQIDIDDDGIGRKKAKEISENKITGNKSKGFKISKKRSILSKKLYAYDIDIEIIDKIYNNIAKGTRIVVKIYY